MTLGELANPICIWQSQIQSCVRTDPQPKQKADLDGRLFVLAGGLSRSDGGIGDFTFLGGRADPSPTVCELIVYRLKQNKLMKNSGKIVEFFIELWYNIINYM